MTDSNNRRAGLVYDHLPPHLKKVVAPLYRMPEAASLPPDSGKPAPSWVDLTGQK